MRKRIVVLLVLFILLFLPIQAFASEDVVSVEIQKNHPSVDSELSCVVHGVDESQISYKWTIDGEEVSNEKSYKTKVEDYESFIQLEIYKGTEVLARDSMYFSIMPVVYINTLDQEYITSREEYKAATMYIQGNDTYESQYDGGIQIKGRGVSSWHSPKKSFKLKLDTKESLFGFGKSKHYVLLNNSEDLSLLRNKIGFDISRQLGLTTTDSELVEVVFNGELQGCYLLCEHIRIGSSLIDIEDYDELGDTLAKKIAKADSSVSQEELKEYFSTNMSFLTEEYIEFQNKKYKVSDYIDVPDNINGGFLYELTDNNKNTNSAFVTNKGVNVNVAKPEYIESNSEVFETAKGILNDFEEAIYSLDGYNSKGVHFTELCDIDSLASYFLTLEILGNEDAASRSRYCYIDRDGVLVFGPVWDFDISSNANKTFMPSNIWVTTTTIVSLATKQDLFKEVLDDPIFQMKVYEKYQYIKPYLEYIVEDNGLLDEYITYSYLSGLKNEYLWVNASKSIKRSYSGAYGDLNTLRNYLVQRVEWLDKQLASEESTYKSLSSSSSENTYKKSSKIQISIQEKSIVNITIPKGYEAAVYINGKKYTEELSFTIASDILSSGVNTIEVIAKKKNKVLRNYSTIWIGEAKAIEIPKHQECNHEYVLLSSHKVTKDDIGRNECKYCKLCHHYFDEENQEISVQSVYTSSKTKTALYGLKTTVVGYSFLLASGILLLVFGIRFLITKLRKEKKHGE